MIEQQRILERAWKLQDKKEQLEEEQVKERALRDAAGELGLDPAYFEEARAQLAAEDAARAAEAAQKLEQRRRRRKSLGIGAALAVVVAGASAFGWSLLRPPEPRIEDFTGGEARWTLETNAGTQASVRWEEVAGRGHVAVIDVDRFAIDADGKFRANLDQRAPIDLTGYNTLSFAVRGEALKVVRVFLETPGERWRSPPVQITAQWTTATLPLEAFERQTRDGGWKVVSWEAPRQIQAISFKVGHFMNGPEAAGEVFLDDLRLE